MKEHELPEWFDGIKYTEGETVTNPLSGESFKCTANQASMYDLIMGAHMTQNNVSHYIYLLRLHQLSLDLALHPIYQYLG